MISENALFFITVDFCCNWSSIHMLCARCSSQLRGYESRDSIFILFHTRPFRIPSHSFPIDVNHPAESERTHEKKRCCNQPSGRPKSGCDQETATRRHATNTFKVHRQTTQKIQFIRFFLFLFSIAFDLIPTYC